MLASSESIAQASEDRDSHVGLLLSDRYRVDALIDRGGMGRVYAGEHVLMHKRVAIKVLHRELSQVPEFVARFEREARAAANIDNEHVVSATDFGKLPDGAVFLVLEYIEGRNLRDEIASGPMPLTRTLHIGRQIATALRSAHALGIVHRDLKPENVMLVEKAGDSDFAKVLDFGIARVPIGENSGDDAPPSKPITKAGMVFGTPEYMPPEQALGQSVDERADIYSLGVIIYEMLAGRRPFVAESQVGVLGQQLSRSVPPVSKRAPGVYIPAGVDTMVRKMMHREASQRFRNADQVLDAIDRHLGYGNGRKRIPTLRDGSLEQTSTNPAPPCDEDESSRDVIPGLEGPLDRLGQWLDGRRGRLPVPLRRLPAPVLFSLPFAAAGLLVGFGVFAALSTKPQAAATAVTAATRVEAPPPPSAPVKATPDELAEAAAAGEAALRSLAAKYPKDAAIPMAISAEASKEKRWSDAVTELGNALELDPSLANSDQVSSALWILAQNKASTEAAFALLAGPMGERGRTILHDLSATAGVRAGVRKRASEALAH
jgi:serine/threonine protein kinase